MGISNSADETAAAEDPASLRTRLASVAAIAIDGLKERAGKVWCACAANVGFLHRLDQSFHQGHSSVVSSLKWGDGHVLSGSYDGSAKLWDERTGEVVLTHSGDGAVTSVELVQQPPSTPPTSEHHGDCDHVCLFTQRNRVKSMRLPATGQAGRDQGAMPEQEVCPAGIEVKSINVSPDGNWVALALIGGEPGSSHLAVCSFNAHGSGEGAGAGAGRDVGSHNDAGRRLFEDICRVGSPHGQGKVWFAAWMGDNSQTVVTGGADGSLAAWGRAGTLRRPSLKLLWRIKDAGSPDPSTGNPSDVWCGVTHGRAKVFIGDGNGEARCWQLGGSGFGAGHGQRQSYAHQLAMQYKGHTGSIRAITSDPVNARSIFTGSTDCTARQWNAETGVCLRIFVHVAGIRNIACRPSVGRGGAEDGVEFVAAGMDGGLYVWKAAEVWMPSEEEQYTPLAIFSDIDSGEVTAKIVETFILLVQVLTSAALVHGVVIDLEWLDDFQGWVLENGIVKGLSGLTQTQGAEKDVATAWLATVCTLMALATAAFVFDAYGKTLAHIAHLNRSGKGIKRHWHYGEVVDFETAEHKRAWWAAWLVDWLVRLACGAFYIPIVRTVLRLVECEHGWHHDSLQEPCVDLRSQLLRYTSASPSAADAAAEWATVGVLALTTAFVLVTIRMAMVDNDVSALPPVPPDLWNPVAIIWHRLRLHDPPWNFLGAISLNPASSWAFLVVQSLEKLVLTVLAVAISWSDVTEKLVPWFDATVIATGVLVSYSRPVYVLAAVSSWHFVVQLLLLVSMLAGAVHLSLKDDTAKLALRTSWAIAIATILVVAEKVKTRF